MAVSNVHGYADLLIDVEALKTSMEVAINSKTPDHAKWVSFKSSAIHYSDCAKRYTELTGDSIVFYNAENLKNHLDTLWPTQKELFEQIYGDLLRLHGRLKRRLSPGPMTGFDELLHPLIRDASIKLYSSGDYRNAVLDAVIALFDHLRVKSGLGMDGDDLCNQAFSPAKPILVFSEVDTESGRNDQRGFMDIFKGFYRGVRNPKAHSLIHDLDAVKAAQYLVLASLLMRRIDGARAVVNQTRTRDR